MGQAAMDSNADRMGERENQVTCGINRGRRAPAFLWTRGGGRVYGVLELDLEPC